MTKQVKMNIPDETVVKDFLEFFGGISKEKRKYKGKITQKAYKLILTFYGCEKYKFDPEVEELWKIYTEITGAHTQDTPINMIKAIDNSPPKLRNKKERAFASLNLMKVEESEQFKVESFKIIVNSLGYGNRATEGYLELLRRLGVIYRVNHDTYGFKENKIFDKYMMKNIDETVRNEILLDAIKESKKVKGVV